MPLDGVLMVLQVLSALDLAHQCLRMEVVRFSLIANKKGLNIKPTSGNNKKTAPFCVNMKENQHKQDIIVQVRWGETERQSEQATT